MPSTSTTLRIPLAAALRHPGNARPVVSEVELAGLAGVAAEIEAGSPVAIDLEPMVRDALLLELPLAPLCNPDCAGLCATCGANHNLTRCECVTSEIDPRWAALRSLEL